MTCNRCKDIHEAQREGNTQNECKCSCHDIFYSTTSSGTYNGYWYNVASPFTTSSTTDCTDNSIAFNTNAFACTCMFDATRCDDCIRGCQE